MSIRQFIAECGGEILSFFLVTIIWAILATGLLILVCSVVAAPVPSSPEPIPAIRPPKCLVGKWVMRLDGGSYDATFHKQGGYQAGGCDGYWKVKGDVLTITERVGKASDKYVSYYTYEIPLLPDSRESTLTSPIMFSLKKR